MDERKIRNYPPIFVTVTVAIIFFAVAVGTMGSRAATTAYAYRPDAVPAATAEPVPEPETVAQTPVIITEAPAEPESAYTYYDVPLDDGLQEYAQDLCAEYEFPYYDIIVAMIGHESSYRETVVSKTNDYGYMQINVCNHEWLREELGVTDMLDGRQNIQCGIYILQGLYHKYGDLGLALMAYNCGENGAAGLWKQGVYSTSYSRSIQQEAAGLAVREE